MEILLSFVFSAILLLVGISVIVMLTFGVILMIKDLIEELKGE